MNASSQPPSPTSPPLAPEAAPLVRWTAAGEQPSTGDNAIRDALHQVNRPLYMVDMGGTFGVSHFGQATLGEGEKDAAGGVPLVGYSPIVRASQLGDPSFCADHRIKFPYMVGSMANGIASTDLVVASAKAGILASFGAAGLPTARIEQAIDQISGAVGDLPFAFNLIHSPSEPAQEAATADLYHRRGVRLVEASAYLDLTYPVVRYRVLGIGRDAQGRIHTPNQIIAKASRVEVATKWFSPPPEGMLAKMFEAGDITPEQAQWAAQIPVAQDLTAEADSGGHTDNRPAITLLPTMLALRDRLQRQYGYQVPLRVGAAGGIATPASAAGAFAMGAAYIVTGSINQACVESGSSDTVRKMLSESRQADVIMAPAADMFEMGVKLQVLKRGTMFAMRASKLYEYYREYNSLAEIPAADQQTLEKTVFKMPLAEVWQRAQQFWAERDPSQIERARRDAKHQMALVFRWYLGLSSRWANTGEPTRQIDYQIWCGPAMGAFNEWVRDSFLEAPENRHVATVARNILYGASVATRVGTLRTQGVRLRSELTNIVPQEVERLEEFLL